MVDLLRPASGRSPQTGGVAQQTEPTSWELFSSLIAPRCGLRSNGNNGRSSSILAELESAGLPIVVAAE